MWSGNITFFVASGAFERIKAEIARNFPSDNMAAHVNKLVRVVAIKTGESKDPRERYKAIEAACIVACRKLLNEEPITCFVTRNQIKQLPTPATVIVDLSTTFVPKVRTR